MSRVRYAAGSVGLLIQGLGNNGDLDGDTKGFHCPLQLRNSIFSRGEREKASTMFAGV